MTIDGTPPTKEEIALNNLDTAIDLEDVMVILVEKDVIKQDAIKGEGEDTFSIDYTELVEEIFDAIYDVLQKRAENTTGWSNGKHGMDPAYQGSSVADAVDEDMFLEVVDEVTRDVVEELRSNTNSGVYEDSATQMKITDITKETIPRSVF